MCTRGMRGTYLYVCDQKLRKYLSQYIDTYHNDGIIYSIDEDKNYSDLMVSEDSEEYRYE